jgi:hypothetical protein
MSNNWQKLEDITAHEWILKNAGESVYNTVWKPLLVTKFADRYRDISMAWLWGKIKLRGSSKENGREVLGYIEGSIKIFIDELVKRIENNDCFLIEISDDPNIFNFEKDYVILTENEFDVITGLNNETNEENNKNRNKKNKEDLLKVYLNIKKFMSFDKNNLSYCYPSHKTICHDCKISSTGAINNIIDELRSLGLLYTYNSGRYEDDKGNIKYPNNFYALVKDTLKPETCDDIIRNYYSSLGITIDKFIK